MGVLVDLAKSILAQAETLEKQMRNASAIQPTLDPEGPLSYPPPSKHPEIFTTRSDLIDSSRLMFRLALGPSDTTLSMTNIEKMETLVLNAITHYKIFDLVPMRGSVSLGEVAGKIEVQEELLTRIMKFAFSMDVFKEAPVGHISHTSLSLAMSHTAGWTQLLSRPEIIASLSSWPEAMRVYTEPRVPGTRQLPFQIGNNTDLGLFDHLNAEPQGMTRFGEAMRSHTAKAGFDLTYLIEGFDWEGLGEGVVVDLGGGTGHISVVLAERFPQLQFVIQDLASSEEGANRTIPAHLKNRITFQAQNFFEPQKKSVDAKVFFMKAIMHDWTDEENIQILRHLIPQVEKGAKIVLCDRILAEAGRKPTHLESFGLMMDLMMWSLLGAKERGLEQWRGMVEGVDPRLRILGVHKPVGSEQGVITLGF